MRLEAVLPSVFCVYFICKRCEKRMVLSKAHPPIYADLDAEAYKTYYCADCVAEMTNGRVQESPGRSG